MNSSMNGDTNILENEHPSIEYEVQISGAIDGIRVRNDRGVVQTCSG